MRYFILTMVLLMGCSSPDTALEYSISHENQGLLLENEDIRISLYPIMGEIVEGEVIVDVLDYGKSTDTMSVFIIPEAFDYKVMGEEAWARTIELHDTSQEDGFRTRFDTDRIINGKYKLVVQTDFGWLEKEFIVQN